MSAPRPPVLSEPLPLELANTRFMRRGRELDGLDTPVALADWLRRVSDRLPLACEERDLRAIGSVELRAARELRDALRTLVAAATTSEALDPDATEILNRAARAAPHWHELTLQPHPALVLGSAVPAVAGAVGAIAEDAMRLLSGPEASLLRACAAPDCILFYRKDHPRRAWCSPRCSNRVRSARHYDRHRAAADPATGG